MAEYFKVITDPEMADELWRAGLLWRKRVPETWEPKPVDGARSGGLPSTNMGYLNEGRYGIKVEE